MTPKSTSRASYVLAVLAVAIWPFLPPSVAQFLPINATRLQGVAISQTAPKNGEVLAYSSSSKRYEPATGSGGAVASVNGKTGTVVLDQGDIGCDPLVTTCVEHCDLDQDAIVALNATDFPCPGLTAPGVGYYWRVVAFSFIQKAGADDYTFYGQLNIAVRTSGGSTWGETVMIGGDSGFIDYYFARPGDSGGILSNFENRSIVIGSTIPSEVPTGRVANADTALAGGGTGFMAGDQATLDCSGTDAVLDIDSVDMDGAILTWHWSNRGTGCPQSTALDLTASGGSMGIGASVDISLVETAACAMGDTCGTVRAAIVYMKQEIQ